MGLGIKEMSAVKSKKVSISMSEQAFADFHHIQEIEGCDSHGQTIQILINAYRTLKNQKSETLDLTTEESQMIERAVELSGMSKKELNKRGLLSEAKTAITLAKRQADLHNTDPNELRKMTFSGVATARIQQAVTKVMDYNDSQTEKKNKFCITESLIHKLTGSNQKAVRDFFETYHTTIDDHNQKHSLTKVDNRKGKGIEFKEMLGF